MRNLQPVQVIHDPPSDGPANMQRDLDLLGSLASELILRVYQWSGHWASYGYFQTEATATAHFPNDHLQFVQRPTGGGLVDHRHDLTYTLLIPKSHSLAKTARAQSYRRIHQAIHQALTSAQIESLLVTQETGASLACFDHPVPGDLIDPQSGKKLAGAAQRRTRHGLLHQGSILAQIPGQGLTGTTLAEAFANVLP